MHPKFKLLMKFPPKEERKMNAQQALKKYQIALKLAQRNYQSNPTYARKLEIYELEELVKHAQKWVH